MKKSFWDILAWIAFAYVVIYAILKVMGVLHSPIPIDIAAIVSTAFFVGKYAQRIDFCIKDVELIKDDLKEVRNELKGDINGLRADFGQHLAKFH
jgi:hypothetical protein